MELNILGLDIQKTEYLVKDLNVLLANFQVYYQNLRGIHWNIKGRGFFELHTKFEELYNDTQIKVDEIAERVLTLGGEPLHTFEDYIANARVPVGKHISKDEKAVALIVSSISELLQLERALLDKSGEANDEGTNAMMSDFIAEQEKTVWMMNAWLNK
ncbi:DNA starvation/stationary phase protection protein [Kordia sp. YSTF-M3]|uniref:DNA starvation/stationary phase protection protein n=1 Tax=Kordia aestuariivivens TaxID=2759037 RepID=A0ABR7Q5J2_9FLAO|nr:Dps family protein [Kordia aestuariivivens]MBC8753798.1 DNA starvation/stationary phase protection protein [Kordia aestuariivivens]